MDKLTFSQALDEAAKEYMIVVDYDDDPNSLDKVLNVIPARDIYSLFLDALFLMAKDEIKP